MSEWRLFKKILSWKHLDLSQRSCPYREKIKEKIPKQDQGLRLAVIKAFSKHEDLAKIAALDTYVGNINRSLESLFYDSKTDRFYSRGLDNAFQGNLASLAFDKLAQLYEEGQIETSELRGLKIYKQTLQNLKREFPVSKCVQLLHILIEKHLGNQAQKDSDFAQKKLRAARIMRKSNESTKDLI